MASGRQHQSINVAALVGGAALVAVAVDKGWGEPWTSHVGFEWPAVIAFAIAFVVGTYLVTPDLDLAEQHVLAKRNWGVLGFIWVPYGYIFAHRGVSHGWFFGPLTRLGYLVGLVAAAIGIAYFAAKGAGVQVPSRLPSIRWDPAWLWPGWPP